MVYKKLRVRKVDGGYRIKYCDDPFNDVYLTDFELGNRRLLDALRLKWFAYEDMIKATNHKGSNLQGKYDRHHRATYWHKKRCTQSCFHVLCGN